MMLLYLLMAGLLPGVLAQLLCPDGQSCTAPLCPNTTVQYMCNISVPLAFTRWIVPVQSCGGQDTTLLLLRQSAQSNCGSQSILCGPFQASNVPPVGDTPCTSSILHVNVTQRLHGSLITCNSSDLSAEYLVGRVKLFVLSAPRVPQLLITAELNGLEVNCSLGDGDEDTHCNITIQMNGALQSVTANITTFNGLTSNTMYPISARAINRCGGYSETSALHWTLPEAPPTSAIQVLQSLINESSTQLDISWSHIGGNVSQYVVKSISGMNIFTSKVSVQSYCVALSCTYNEIVRTSGSHYTITISSVNDGGEGPESGPVQAQSKSSFSPSYSVEVGVGVGVGVGVLLLIIVICILILTKRRSRHLNVMEGSELIEVDTLKVVKRIPHYIKNPHNGTVLTIQDNRLIFKYMYAANDTQLWYLDYQPDNSVIIVSKMNEMVLTCTEGEIMIQDRRGDDSQKWLQDNNRIVSSKYNTVMCVKDPGNVPLCVMRTSEHGIHFCYLQSSLKRIPHYIRSPHNGTALTIQNGRLIFTTLNYVPDDTQLWYLDEQPDNSFLIVSKMNKMVLACTESEIVIQDRHGDDSQKWLQENNRIVSSKYNTVMCVKDPGNVPACVKKTSGHEIHLCHLQSSLMVPMCLMDEGDGSVLEISGDKVIVNPNMDLTNLCQHWCIYPDNQSCTNERKALQLDEQWTVENGQFIVKSKTKTFKAHSMIRNYFIIRFKSYCLTWDLSMGIMVVQANVNKSMPFERHLWMLDLQPNGTFMMASCVNNKMFFSNIDNTLVCGPDCQLWKREGHFIKSVKSHGYIGVSIGSTVNGSVSRPDDESTKQSYLPTICTDTNDRPQSWYECATTKVVIQVFRIVHQDTDFVLSLNNASSKVFMSPRNSSLPDITQFWVLDYRLDGTFLILTDTTERLVLSCDPRMHQSTERQLTLNQLSSDESQLTLSQFSSDESQLWKFDGGRIESVKFKGQVISLMTGSQTSLCLSTTSTTDTEQLFRQESYTPVLIRCLMDDTVLELDDTSVLKFSVADESRLDSQVWFLKYKRGFNNPWFMIISKKNGKALQAVGRSKVETSEQDPNNKAQQWRRNGLFIKSQNNFTMATTDAGQSLVLAENTTSNKQYCQFEFQHFAVESYF